MKKKIFLHIFIYLILILLFVYFFNFQNVKGESLTENINEQINNIDFSNLESLSSDYQDIENTSFLDRLFSLINGNFSINYNNFFSYLKDIIIGDITLYLPQLLTLIAVAIFYTVISTFSFNNKDNSVFSVINLVCIITVISVLISKIFFIYQNINIALNNITKLIEIMSPIMLSLMVASGGNVSATLFQPAVSILSSIVLNIFSYIVLPLILICIVFSFLSSITDNINLNKFVDFFHSIIKWVIGLSTALFTIFLSIQGLGASSFDGISIKATKYALSNSIPLIGGFMKEGFDLVICGSILIKNSVGISIVFILFSIMLPLIIDIAIFTLMLKFVSAITETISDSKVSVICQKTSKNISYFNVTIIFASFLFFITVVLLIFSASAFI